MKTALITTIAIVALLLTAGVVYAKQYGDPGGGKHAARMIEKVTQQLDLDEQQQARLAQFSEKWQAMRKAKREGQKEGRQELFSLLDSDTLDQERALALFDEKHQAFRNQMQEMVATFAAFSDSLNGPQRRELKEIFAKRMEQRRGGSRPPWAN